MQLFFAVFTLFSGVYLTFLSVLVVALLGMKNRKTKDSQGISVIIAARNEEHNLPQLIQALASLDYPLDKYEIIIVNDHSTDATKGILESCTQHNNLRVIHYYEDKPDLIGKKAALAQGIHIAKYDILAFTDADCLPPSTWLTEVSAAFTDEVDYVLGFADLITSAKGSRFRLKNFERSVYYTLACAGLFYHRPITSSACNMMYRKSLFGKANGFEGIGHLASGDDDLLLMKMNPFIRKATFNFSKELSMISNEGKDRMKHHHTNIRRASKFKYFPLWLKGLGVFIFMYFILFYISLFLFSSKGTDSILITSIILKTGFEFTLLTVFLFRLKRLELLTFYPIQILLFPLQFIFYALRGMMGKYTWK